MHQDVLQVHTSSFLASICFLYKHRISSGKPFWLHNLTDFYFLLLCFAPLSVLYLTIWDMSFPTRCVPFLVRMLADIRFDVSVFPILILSRSFYCTPSFSSDQHTKQGFQNKTNLHQNQSLPRAWGGWMRYFASNDGELVVRSMSVFVLNSKVTSNDVAFSSTSSLAIVAQIPGNVDIVLFSGFHP